jgi:hypothetical protein
MNKQQLNAFMLRINEELLEGYVFFFKNEKWKILKQYEPATGFEQAKNLAKLNAQKATMLAQKRKVHRLRKRANATI